MPAIIRAQSEHLKSAASAYLPAQVGATFDESIRGLLDQDEPADVVAARGDTHGSFTVSDAAGAALALAQLLETDLAVNMFHWDGWYPDNDLALRPDQGELPDPRAGRIALSSQQPDQSLSTVERAEREFTVLPEPGARVRDRIDISIEQANEAPDAQRRQGLKLAQVTREGATLDRDRLPSVINRNHAVGFVDVQPDSIARTTVADMMVASADLGA